tara:strand:- start:1638 stop:1931 length:294 start_codon:yes stop_codon:yes gene_type:complete
VTPKYRILKRKLSCGELGIIPNRFVSGNGVFSFLLSRVGPNDALAAPWQVQIRDVSYSLGCSGEVDSLQSGHCRELIPKIFAVQGEWKAIEIMHIRF